MAVVEERTAAFELKQVFKSLDLALTFAAAETHPDWERAGEYGLRYTGKRRGQNPMKLLNWFYATYPERVDAIKRQFSNDTEGKVHEE